MIDFATCFEAIHGSDRAPYPWQEELAHRLATATPPRAIVVPTGGGKTATIDALVYALAAQARRSPLLRTIGVRTVWAIDRRILVDEVHAHATALAARLDDARDDPGDVLHEVAIELSSLTGGGRPLEVTRWRGGIAPERVTRHPFQPEIITSTVAQIGSRLLFRGYGVGSRSLALAAGLAGVDTTICLDEAHLAGPFRETVAAVRRLREDDPVVLPPLALITLTATPEDAVAPPDRVEIGPEDRAALGARITGPKTAVLVEPESPKDADRRRAILHAVMEHVEAGRQVVACVVNTVRTAIEVSAELERSLPQADHALLIGPQRPADRADMLERHRATLFERTAPERLLVVVATQTFEVGLDADVEVLVTESASATALVQRLGRLNRAGTGEGRATIVRDQEAWLYRDEEADAWAWLTALQDPDGCVDVSVQALADAPERPAARVRATAPDLSRDVVDRLVQTEPRPARRDDPDVDAFLNGVESAPAADVHVAWRCDLRAGAAGDWFRRTLLTLAPPRREELVTMGIGRVRALLASLAGAATFGRSVTDEPDVEGGRGEGAMPVDAPVPPAVTVLRGDEVLTGGHDLRPGDTIVLPSSAGGYRMALAPASRAAVPEAARDLRALRGESWADLVSLPIRLSDEVLAAAGMDAGQRRRVLRGARKIANEQSDPRALLADLPDLAVDSEVDVDLRVVTTEVDLFAGDDDEFDLEDDEPAREDDDQTIADDSERAAVDDVFVLTLRRRPDRDELRGHAAQPPTLDAHAGAVTDRLDSYLTGAALPEPLAEALRLAARAHDHGKADPRIQAYFRGGAAGLGDAPIAKSTFGTKDRRADRAARRAAGLPADLRHEVESVTALLGAEVGVAATIDHELLLHLVGTHHGLGRPIPRLPRSGVPPRRYLVDVAGIRGVGTGDGAPATHEGAWPKRFWSVVDRYGAWGSAYLTGLLMLADRSVSAEGG